MKQPYDLAQNNIQQPKKSNIFESSLFPSNPELNKPEAIPEEELNFILNSIDDSGKRQSSIRDGFIDHKNGNTNRDELEESVIGFGEVSLEPLNKNDLDHDISKPHFQNSGFGDSNIRKSVMHSFIESHGLFFFDAETQGGVINYW